MRAPSLTVQLALAAALILSVGCESSSRDRVLSIDADGIVAGLVFFDADGNLEPDEDDPPVPGVRVRLLPAGTPDTLSRAASGTDGIFVFPAVPVGRYSVLVDPASVPDTVQLARVDTSQVQVTANDTVVVNVAVATPTAITASVASMRHPDR